MPIPLMGLNGPLKLESATKACFLASVYINKAWLASSELRVRFQSIFRGTPQKETYAFHSPNSGVRLYLARWSSVCVLP